MPVPRSAKKLKGAKGFWAFLCPCTSITSHKKSWIAPPADHSYCTSLPDYEAGQPTNCQVVQFLVVGGGERTKKKSKAEHLQCHNTCTKENPKQVPRESQVVLAIMLCSYHLFPGVSTPFPRIKNETLALTVTWLAASCPTQGIAPACALHPLPSPVCWCVAALQLGHPKNLG